MVMAGVILVYVQLSFSNIFPPAKKKTKTKTKKQDKKKTYSRPTPFCIVSLPLLSFGCSTVLQPSVEMTITFFDFR